MTPQAIIPWSEVREDWAREDAMTDSWCSGCGLDDGCISPRMEPDITGLEDGYAADVMFIGEAPGADEDDQGVPFVGDSGKLLRLVIEDVGLDQWNLMFTNVVRCRPPDNAKPKKKQMDACISRLQAEIEEYDPEIIVLLGNVPLKAILGDTGITNWRGVTVERDGRTYLPAFHPAFILRNATSLPMMQEDFNKIVDLLEGQEASSADQDYIIEIVKTLPRTRAMIDTIQAAGVCSFDTETTSLRPYDIGQRILMCSFAVDEPVKRAWAVVPSKPIMSLLKNLLEDDRVGKIGHNIKFDAMAVYALWDAWIESAEGDSMLLSHLIDASPGRHGLKILAGRFLGMYDYDKPLRDWYEWHKDADPSKGGDMGLVPEEVLADYAAKDAIATLELSHILGELLTPKQQILYDELIMPASAILTQMQANGTIIDQEVVEDYIPLYEAEQGGQYLWMEGDLIFKKWDAMRKRKDEKFYFNPNSHPQVRELLFDSEYFDLEPLGYTKTGLASTAWDYIKEYAHDVPFVEHLRYYKLCGKMLGTYLRPAISSWPSTGDGRVRSSYRLHGTITGRLASRDPNLQNIPTPEKEPDTILAEYPIKDIFTHTHPEGCLLVADFSGMELRTMASIAQCQGMIDAFEKGQDVHSIIACELGKYYGHNWEYEQFMRMRRSDIEEEAKATVAFRYRSKWVNWTLLFGGGWYTLRRLYGLDEIEAKSLIDIYYTMFPEVLEYKGHILDFARTYGYIESPFGRRRYLPYINEMRDAGRRKKSEREAINMPIQSGAGDILLCTLVVLDELIYDQDFKSMMVNTVHDSVMWDVWPGELHRLAALNKDVMENITTKYGPAYFPNLDFSWFTVPLKADLEVGSHYGSLEHYQ